MYEQLKNRLKRPDSPEKSRGAAFKQAFLHHAICAYRLNVLARRKQDKSLAQITRFHIFDLLDWARVHWSEFGEDWPLGDISADPSAISVPSSFLALEKEMESAYAEECYAPADESPRQENHQNRVL